MKKKALYLLALLLILVNPLKAQTLLYSFNFNNDSGSSITNSGIGGAASITMKNSALVPTDLHGVAGSGVSGQSWDYAFNNTASTGMGNTGTGGQVLVARTSSASDELATSLVGLTSFTLTGWFKTDSVALNNNARLISYGGFDLRGSSSGEMSLLVNTTEIASSSSSAYGAIGSWVFFAVTYDSLSSSAKFYQGTTSDSAVLVSTKTLSSGAVSTSGTLIIGNWGDGARPFDGYMDNVSIYGSKSTTTADGALSLVSIQSIQASAIPEPSSIALLIAGVVGLGSMILAKKKLSVC